MSSQPKIHFLLVTAVSLALINSVKIHFPLTNQFNSVEIGIEKAEAKQSGGRSGGGSFQRSSPSSSGSSPSRSTTTSPSSSSSSPSRSTTTSPSSSSSSPSRSTTISPRNTRPTPVYPSNSGSSGGTTIIVVPNNSSSSDREYIAPETNSDYTTPETNSDYTTPNTNSDYTTPNTNSDYTTPNTNSDYTTPDTNSDYTTPNTNSDYTTPNTNSDSQNSNWVANLLVFGLFLILGLITFSVFFFILKSLMSSNSNNNTVANAVANERDNDIVTISKLQVALLATATGVQTELSQLSLNVDTETEAGLMELLQESALILLRKSDHWSHVSSSSESINIENAETAFNRISLSERSKFSHESLVNVSGRISTRTINSSSANLGSYLVVTLLAGTADDQPLFGEIRTVNELKAALEKLAAMRSDYLMKFELLWTPQTEGESLSSDEMLSEYAAMYQLV